MISDVWSKEENNIFLRCCLSSVFKSPLCCDVVMGHTHGYVFLLLELFQTSDIRQPGCQTDAGEKPGEMFISSQLCNSDVSFHPLSFAWSFFKWHLFRAINTKWPSPETQHPVLNKQVPASSCLPVCVWLSVLGPAGLPGTLMTWLSWMIISRPATKTLMWTGRRWPAGTSWFLAQRHAS